MGQDQNPDLRGIALAVPFLARHTPSPKRADGKLFGGLQAMRGAAEPDLAGRVSARLRWDKSLADVKIEVSASGSILELKGSVREPAQKKRVLELAESTDGVDKVTDNLEVATHDP